MQNAALSLFQAGNSVF